MNELHKRILTSFVLLITLYIALLSPILLSITLILIFFQIFFEIFNMLKKILFNKKFLLLLILSTVLIYLSFSLLLLWNFILSSNNEIKLYLLLVLSICISTDIGGYLFGKIFKGKKLTRISPKKTYSGMIGSYLLSFVCSYLIFNSFFDSNTILITSITISSISQLGDLFFSFLKRNSKLKDTGNILPGHGGALDRLDGLFFALPFSFVLLKLL